MTPVATLKRIITKDNLQLVGLLYEPKTRTDKVLIHVHGMGGNFYENKFLDFIANRLINNNIAFFVFNNRGCEAFKDLTKTVDGKRTFVRIGSAYEKFEDSVLDIDAAIGLTAELGFKNIHLSGHSLGSPKVAYYLAETKDSRIQSALFLSPSDMLGLARANLERFQQDIGEANEMIKIGKGGELLSRQVWDEYPICAATECERTNDDNLPKSSEIEGFVQKAQQKLKDLSFGAKKAIVMNVVDKVIGTKDELQVYGYIPIESNINVFTINRHRRASKRRQIDAF